jgi:hypothetical protein
VQTVRISFAATRQALDAEMEWHQCFHGPSTGEASRPPSTGNVGKGKIRVSGRCRPAGATSE